jgi:protein TIF31
MYLLSNIFITKALDSIHSYSHLGGDAAAHVCHGKDAEGVKVINKLDVDGLGVLGHVVVDWAGGRWVGQSVLPGIFSRRIGDAEAEAKPEEVVENQEKKDKEDWVKVDQNGSPTKSTDASAETEEETEPEQLDNPLIIYGLDSESQNLIHYDAHTHKLFSKVAEQLRLAPHTVKDGKNADWEFYASCEVKGLRGSDGRRYLLDLIRLSGVDVRWLEDDVEAKDGLEEYPHRVVLLRQELVEVFWESELKRWARGVAAERAKASGVKAVDGNGDEEKVDGDAKEPVDNEPNGETEVVAETSEAKSEEDKPAKVNGDEAKDKTAEPPMPEIDASQFKLLFNPDAFVDQPLPKSSKSDDTRKYVPSTQTSLEDPSIKAVRDASSFLRDIAVPGLVLDVLTGNQGGVVDGGSLSKVMHGRGINVRYLGKVMERVEEFSKTGNDETEGGETFLGHLSAFKVCPGITRSFDNH